MRGRTLSVVIAVACALTTPVFAKDVYLSIGGSVGAFRTDARIFNPSSSKDIQIQAWYLPVGNNDGSAVQPVTVTVPKRQMAVYDDVVSSLFKSSGTGAIRLSSTDDFVATQRIYAQATGGTLGQFVPGLEVSTAKKAGVLIQLKSSAAFRTNIGVVNPNTVPASVTWRLYDKNNALVATGSPMTMPAYAVIGPTNMTGTLFFNPGTADLSDAWVGYTSDQAIFAYASVVDNGTTDPTFIPASEDTGAPASTPAAPTARSFDVKLASFAITVTPAMDSLKAGDQVTFHIQAIDPGHGFQLVDPDGAILIPDRSGPYPTGTIFDQTFKITVNGTYSYFCTHPTCGSGHNSMQGTFDVGTPTDPTGGKY